MNSPRIETRRLVRRLHPGQADYVKSLLASARQLDGAILAALEQRLRFEVHEGGRTVDAARPPMDLTSPRV
ncbi:hypothetical protein ACN47A_37220 [Myxococcus fulvus]|uniref:hypothetical protein n=1 Tax=Myxococcus fulvus TaxID=33 RepID=UPI003B9A8E25